MRFIIAGCYEQAALYATTQGWKFRKEWHYVDSVNLVLGVAGITIIVVGEYWTHAHWRHVEAQHDLGNLNLEFPDETP